MTQWPIWVLLCLALCGCQTAAHALDDSCPSPTLCDDPDSEAHVRPGPAIAPLVTLAAYRPLFPGCPTTLQVMARPNQHQIVYRAARPREVPETAPDLSNDDCAPLEAPLRSTSHRPAERDLAAR
jgi:hypothetical protein